MAQGGSRKVVETPSAQGGSRFFLLAVGALIVVGLAAVAIIAGSRGDDADTVTPTEGADDADGDVGTEAPVFDGAETAAIQVGETALAPLPQELQLSDASTDPAFGKVAPTLTGTSFDGSEVVIGPDGSAKVIYFVAHWCPHCQAEIPMIQGLIDDGKLPDDLEVYAVSTAVDKGRGNYPPSEWLQREGFTPTVVRDDDATSALAAFGASSFPFAVYLDSDNQVVARSAGTLDAETTEALWQSTIS